MSDRVDNIPSRRGHAPGRGLRPTRLPLCVCSRPAAVLSVVSCGKGELIKVWWVVAFCCRLPYPPPPPTQGKTLLLCSSGLAVLQVDCNNYKCRFDFTPVPLVAWLKPHWFHRAVEERGVEQTETIPPTTHAVAGCTGGGHREGGASCKCRGAMDCLQHGN